MTALIETTDPARVRQLIFEARGGILSEAEAKALEEYLTFSVKLYVGAIAGKLCCAWGLVPPTLLSDRAHLWLFSTDHVEEHKFIFVRQSQRAMEEMLAEWPVITGFCEVGSARSIRWLRWLGARFGSPLKTLIPFEIRVKNG